MKVWKRILPSLCLAVASLSCATNKVQYKPFFQVKIEPTARAVAADGTSKRIEKLASQAQMPHLSPREQYEASLKVTDAITSQVGSRDYDVIGVIEGRGNHRSSLPKLRKAICEKAAKEGGDVVLFVNSGITEKAYTYVSPGWSTTNVEVGARTDSYGSAYSVGNRTYGSGTSYTEGWGTSHTTYMPSQTYTGVHRLPHATGLVLKHFEHGDQIRREVLDLDDDSIPRYLEDKKAVFQDPEMSYQMAKRISVELLQRYRNSSAKTQSFEEWLAKKDSSKAAD